MFTTKKDVDKHVRTGFAKLRSENEKNLRGYSIAKLYAKIGEYQSALHYVSTYLVIKEDSAQAHRLAGQCHERLKRPDKAILSYKRSLQIDPKQSDLLIEVCKLLLAVIDSDVIANNNRTDNGKATPNALAKPETLRYWCELAEQQRVQHEAVVNLKLSLMRRDQFTPGQLDEMLQREIVAQPHSVPLRIQFLRHMLDQPDRVEEAFRYVNDVQNRQMDAFVDSLDWYTSVAQVIAKLDANTNVTSNGQRAHRNCWSYWLLATTTAERQLYLTLCATAAAVDRRTAYTPIAVQLNECATLVHRLDQVLDAATRAIMGGGDNAACLAGTHPGVDVATAFVDHFGGQLCLHAATLIYFRERLQKVHWRETQRATLPLLLLALNSGGSRQFNDSLASNARKQQPETVRSLMLQWQRERAFRRVQAGRTLLSYVDDTKRSCTVTANIRKICSADKMSLCTSQSDLLALIRQYTSDEDWRRQLFRTLFDCLGSQNTGEQQFTSSFLVNAPALSDPVYNLADIDELNGCAEQAQWLRAGALDLQVYLVLSTINPNAEQQLAEYRSKVFDGLSSTAANLKNGGAETLNQLDVDAVLMATVLQTQQRLTEEQLRKTGDQGQTPAELSICRPYAIVVSQLATDEQKAWWLAAYKVYKNQPVADSDLVELRATIQHGLEAVRGAGTPKMDLTISLRLGQLFAARAAMAVKQADRLLLDARADALFKFGLHLLRQRADGTLTETQYMFRAPSVASESAVTAAAEEAVTYVASRYIQQHAYQACIDEMVGIALPSATYSVAESYRKLEQSQTSSASRQMRRTMLEKAREALLETQDLLDQPYIDRTHSLRQLVPDEMRSLQIQIGRLAIGGAGGSNVNASFTNGSGGGDDNNYPSHNESASSLNRSRRQTTTMLPAAVAMNADLPNPRADELKHLLTQIMEQLSIMQEDMVVVRSRLGNIEDRLPAVESASNPLEDYFLEEELNQQQQQQQQQTSIMHHQRTAATMLANNPYAQFAASTNSSVPMMGGLNQINPYGPTMQQQQQFYNAMYMYGGGAAGAGPIVNPIVPGLAYGMVASPSLPQHQQPQPHHQSNSNLMGLLQAPPPSTMAPFTPTHLQQPPPSLHQQQQQPPSFVQLQQPPPFQQQQQQQQQNVSHPTTISVASTEPTASSTSKSTLTTSTTTPITTKSWNATMNNAPVEKGPPVNVVITSSDPLPQMLAQNRASTTTNTMTAATASNATLSVTIPAHHIKNNPVAAVLPTIDATSQAPIFGAFVKTPSSLTNSTTSIAPPVAMSTPNSTPFNIASNKKTSDSTPPPALFGALAPATGKTSTLQTNNNTSTTKPSPFANFTFGASLPVVNPTKSSTAATSSAPGSSGLFGSLSSGTNAFGGFGKSVDVVPAPGSGLFASLTATKSVASAPKLSGGLTPTKNNDSLADGGPSTSPSKAGSGAVPTDSADAVDDYVPTAHFEPVIALPDLIETRTGEEEEHICFEHRAKLLRYVKETKEWKERGIGQMKVLVNKQDASKVRLLMRREQVLKLCCNQLLQSDTKFNTLGSAGTSMTWFGQDFSENELQVELFAIRFKTAEMCREFHDAVLAAQNGMIELSAKTDVSSATNVKPKVVAEDSSKSATTGFGNMFKPVIGSWDCTGCYVTNQASASKCVACGGSAPNTTKSTVASVAPVVSAPLAVTSGEGFGNMFKPKSGSWECTACYITNKPETLYCLACESPKDATVPVKEKTHALLATSADAPKFSFGVPMSAKPLDADCAALTTKTATIPASTSNTNSGPFSFGTFTAMSSGTTTNKLGSNDSTTDAAKSGFSFSMNGGTLFGSNNTPAVGSSVAATSGQLGVDVKLQPKEQFTFVYKPKSPPKPINSTSTEYVSDDEAATNLEEENNTYFAPVIALPDKVDVVTGEENELVLYAHRAKLYRFCESEWKERGLGEVKILRHCDTGKLRVVMRREQVHKICLNHALTEEIEYTAKDDKSWHFVANDYSQGAVELLQFCLRFKNADIASAFKTAACDAVAGKLTGSNEASITTVNESDVSVEDKQLAEQLGFSLSFFAYRNAMPCAGCRGCSSEEFVFPSDVAVEFSDIDTEPLPLTMPRIHRNTTQNEQLSAKASTLKPSAMLFGSPLSKTTSLSPKPNGDSFFGGLTTFGSAPTTATTSSDNITNSIFGGIGEFGLSKSVTKTNMFKSSTLEPNPVLEYDINTESAPKPLPVKSFLFGNMLGTDTPPLKPVSTTISGENSASFTSSSSPFTFSLPTNTNVPTSNEANITSTQTTSESAAKQFSFKLALNTAAEQPFATTENSSSITPKSIFGGAAIFKPAEKKSTASSIFGNASVNNSNTNASPSNIFGGFESSKSTEKTTTFDANSDAVPFKDTGLSFSSLATSANASAVDVPTVFTDATATGSSKFFGLSNKDKFTSFQPNAAENVSASGSACLGDNATSGGEDANYDPHYDPIIALPDEIVVRTGEEDEQKVFGERAHLYRYDTTNREWKERGIGELKILHHTINGTYRILLRREVIHKLVLNHALTADLSITPMQKSERAFCWATNNYADDPAGVVEQLSIRFKNSDIGSQFAATLETCMAQLRLRPQAD